MTAPVQLLDAARGYAPVTNLVAAGDPDVHLVDGRWTMHLGAAHTGGGVGLFSAQLPPGAPVTSDEWAIVTEPGDPATARPLLPPGPAGRYDEWRHTPSYVAGGGRERLFFTGSRPRTDGSGTGDVDLDRAFSLGVLEREAGRWVPRDAPILTGTSGRADVLEPKALHADGRWRVWYLSTPKEAGNGVLPDNRIAYVESADGEAWSAPRVVLDTDNEDFDAAVCALGDGRFAMVTTASPNMFGEPGFPRQGLWLRTGRAPTGDPADWSAPKQVLAEADAPAWARGAIYGPCLLRDGDALHVFFTAAPVPDPQPYVLSVARLDVPVAQLPDAP